MFLKNTKICFFHGLEWKCMDFKSMNFIYFLAKQADLYQPVTFFINDYLQYVNSEILFLLMI